MTEDDDYDTRKQPKKQGQTRKNYSESAQEESEEEEESDPESDFGSGKRQRSKKKFNQADSLRFSSRNQNTKNYNEVNRHDEWSFLDEDLEDVKKKKPKAAIVQGEY